MQAQNVERLLHSGILYIFAWHTLADVFCLHDHERDLCLLTTSYASCHGPSTILRLLRRTSRQAPPLSSSIYFTCDICMLAPDNLKHDMWSIFRWTRMSITCLHFRLIKSTITPSASIGNGRPSAWHRSRTSDNITKEPPSAPCQDHRLLLSSQGLHPRPFLEFQLLRLLHPSSSDCAVCVLHISRLPICLLPEYWFRW